MHLLCFVVIFSIYTCLAQKEFRSGGGNLSNRTKNIEDLREAKEQAEREERQKNSLVVLSDELIKDTFVSNLQASKSNMVFNNHTQYVKELKFDSERFNCGKEFDIYKLVLLAKAHKHSTPEETRCIEEVETTCGPVPLKTNCPKLGGASIGKESNQPASSRGMVAGLPPAIVLKGVMSSRAPSRAHPPLIVQLGDKKTNPKSIEKQPQKGIKTRISDSKVPHFYAPLDEADVVAQGGALSQELGVMAKPDAASIFVGKKQQQVDGPYERVIEGQSPLNNSELQSLKALDTIQLSENVNQSTYSVRKEPSVGFKPEGPSLLEITLQPGPAATVVPIKPLQDAKRVMPAMDRPPLQQGVSGDTSGTVTKINSTIMENQGIKEVKYNSDHLQKDKSEPLQLENSLMGQVQTQKRDQSFELITKATKLKNPFVNVLKFENPFAKAPKLGNAQKLATTVANVPQLENSVTMAPNLQDAATEASKLDKTVAKEQNLENPTDVAPEQIEEAPKLNRPVGKTSEISFAESAPQFSAPQGLEVETQASHLPPNSNALAPAQGGPSIEQALQRTEQPYYIKQEVLPKPSQQATVDANPPLQGQKEGKQTLDEQSSQPINFNQQPMPQHSEVLFPNSSNVERDVSTKVAGNLAIKPADALVITNDSGILQANFQNDPQNAPATAYFWGYSVVTRLPVDQNFAHIQTNTQEKSIPENVQNSPKVNYVYYPDIADASQHYSTIIGF